MYNRLGFSMPLLFALAAAACTPGKINYVHVDSSYSPQQYSFVPYSRAMRAEVSGNPFDMTQEDFNRLVNVAIQPSGVQPSDSSPYRIHIAFGVAATSRTFACGAVGQNSGKAGLGTIYMVAALCPGSDGAMTYLTSSVDGISGPDDPQFRQFLRSAVVKLFPSQTQDTRDNEKMCLVPGC